MNILIDENMPYAAALFGKLGKITAKAGRSLRPEDLIDIDALMIRSVTCVNEKLLAKANRLKFVGTATAGTDHVDTQLLHERGIFFTQAPGCNKVGVAEYVISALLVLSLQEGFELTSRKVGIVGAGNVGTYLSKCLSALNIPFMLCDPPKEKEGDKRTFHSLQTLLLECDVISLHTPLTKNGECPTFHLIGSAQLNLLNPHAILINAARGAVVNNQALKSRLSSDKTIRAVLDVFEFEPEVDLDLLSLLAFATPHIAGYGLEGKARGTTMIYNAFCAFIDHDDQVDAASLLPRAPIFNVSLSKQWDRWDLGALCQLIYDIRRDDASFRREMSNLKEQRSSFDRLRQNYWDRREYSAITVAAHPECGLESLANLGFTVEEKT